MNNTPSVKKNLALSTAYQILSIAVPIVTAPYVSRVLGAEGVGVYSFTSSIATYFAMFAHLGTMSYGRREISRARNDKKQLSRLFWEIESLVVITTFSCLFIWLLWCFFAPEYNIIYLILTMTLLGVVADISWFFSGLEQFKYIVIRNSIVKITGVILLFLFIKEKSDITLYVLLMTLIQLLGALSMWFYIPKMIDFVDWRTIRLKMHFKETLIYFIPTIATSIYTILNKVLLGFMGGDIRENGFFEQVSKIIGIAEALTFVALNSVLGARIAFLFAENKFNEIRKRIENSLDYILFMGTGLTVGIIAIAPRFVPWFFGSEFTDAVVLLQLFSPIILIVGISNCLGSHYYTPAGLRKKSACYIIVGACVNLILNIILIPVYGAVGAAIGSLIAELTVMVLYFVNCNGYMTLSQVINNGWKKCLSAAFMFLCIWYVCSQISDNTISIFVSFTIGLLTYLSLLLILKDRFVLSVVMFAYNKIVKR